MTVVEVSAKLQDALDASKPLTVHLNPRGHAAENKLVGTTMPRRTHLAIFAFAFYLPILFF